MENVLLKIEKQTGYNFIYDEDKLKIPSITVKVTNVSIEKALDACFADLPATYSIVGNNIILKPVPPSVLRVIKRFFVSTVQVRGLVTDTLGNPLSRATIFFAKRAGGRPNAATSVTNEKGLFNLDAEVGDEIGVSFIGFKTVTFTVTADMPFQTIVLHSDVAQLVEVKIQTGYQTLSKERATGSFSKPDMRVITNRSSTLDLINRLEGQVPELLLKPMGIGNYTNDRTTGARTRSAVIRGESSINLNTQPLYVVNGVIVSDFSAINLDDITDITVLKDAAAAAIWGAQASNGVIVVVTKSGSRNQALNISYNGFINLDGKPDFDYARGRYLTSGQYIDVSKQLFDPLNYPYSSINSPYNYTPISPSQQVLYDQEQGTISPAMAKAKLDSIASMDNTNQVKDLWFRNAYTTNHTISLSGGARTYSVYGSLGYANAIASTIGENSTSYKINLTQTFNPNERFLFSLNTQLANNIRSSRGNFSPGADVLPYQLFRDQNGNNINMPFLSGWTADVIKNYSDLSQIDMGTYQLFDELNYTNSKTNSYAINLVGNATVNIWKGLQYLGTYGYAVSPTNMLFTQDNRSYAYRRQLLNNTFAGDPPSYLIPVEGEFYNSSDNNQRRWTVRNQLAYNFSGRGGNDLLSLQIGQEANENFSKISQRSIYGYDPQLQTYPLIDYQTLNNGVFGTIGGYGGYLQRPFSEEENMYRYSSYFALASYTLNQKYSIDASWRTDHSNLFGSDISAQNKPAFSAGIKWNLKNEGFISTIKWLDALALRATYGVTGNSPYVGAATFYDVLYAERLSNYSYPVIGGPAYQLATAKNAKLSWEATRTTNLGVDFAILQSRLNGSIEYYHKNTTDLLGNSPVNYFTGATSSTANIGKLVNNGISLTLNSVNLKTNDFSWQSSFLLGHNKNKIVEYQIPSSYENAPFFKLSGSNVIGYPRNSLFAFKYAGLDNRGYPQVYLKDGTITSAPDKPTGDDLVYMGTTVPKVNGGIVNNFRYKQFQLSVNMYYSLGAVMRRDVNQFYSGMITANNNLGGNLNVEFLQRWQTPGDEKNTNIPGYLSVDDYTNRSIPFYTSADINVVSASYLKLNEVALSYELAPKLLRWLKIQSASLRLQVNNIMLWKANKYGINPEFQEVAAGIRSIPVNQRTLTMGTSINF
ncbi:SusC/RagA family TonB-linked outer membrane protein [Pedobacter sp.]